MVKQYPFPHLVIYDAIPKKFVEILTNNFIIQSFDLNANNKRLDISASEASTNNALIDEWKEFIKFHSSSDFFLQVIKIFEESMSGCLAKIFKALKQSVSTVAKVTCI